MRVWSTGVAAARWSRGGLCALALLAASGCAKEYIRVDARLVALRGIDTRPQVSATESYRKALPSMKVLSLRPPDSCRDETAAVAEGRARASDAIMQINCGVWLAEMERGLVSTGYRVVSWDTIARLERTRNIATYLAAREFGVDAIILINSLEAHEVGQGSSEELTHTYYRSNPDGAALGEALLSTATRGALKRMVNTRFNTKDSRGNTAVTATIDATIVLVSAGEAIWFYRQSKTHNLVNVQYQSFLFRGREWPTEVHFRPVKPRTVTDDRFEEQARSQDVQVASVGDARNPYHKIRLDLIKGIASDFVNRFRSGM